LSTQHITPTDKQASNKKGKAFMPAAERVKMVRSLGCVDAAMEAPDDDSSVCKAIEMIHPDIFAIGLDEGPDYMKAERDLCQKLGIQVVCPLGARIQSSSWLLDRAAENKRNEAAKAEAAAAAEKAE
jgi:glycerol-3-phosphate cytidylyltransferase-like family protein